MIDKLQDTLDDWGIRHFSADESPGLIYLRRWGEYDAPPPDYWERMRPTLQIADAGREILGAPVLIVSGWRPEEYNKILPGSSPTSEHKEFRALDLRPVDRDLMEKFRAIMVELVRYARLAGVDARLIHYAGFVHVDVNAADWKPRQGLDNRSG